MKPEIYRTLRFDKQLETLQKGNKKERLAVEMATKIIISLGNGLLGTETLRNKLTRNGELRLDDGIKFDLGSGYRMVALNKKDKFILLFAGSHDDCDQWLNIRRRKKVHIIPNSTISPPTATDQQAPRKEPDAPDQRVACDSYEEKLMAKIDDNILRDIFKGICVK